MLVALGALTKSAQLRLLRGLFAQLPYTGTLAIVASASMAGVPLLNGFLSREMFFAGTALAPLSTVIFEPENSNERCQQHLWNIGQGVAVWAGAGHSDQILAIRGPKASRIPGRLIASPCSPRPGTLSP